MSNFDLRKYLKENNITFNDSKSIEYTFGSVNEAKIKVGDVVKVKKYGWLMRVDDIDGNMYYLENEPTLSKKAGKAGNPGSYLASDIDKVNESIDEVAPQLKKSNKDEKLESIMRQLAVMANDNSTYNRTAVKDVKRALKILEKVHFQ